MAGFAGKKAAPFVKGGTRKKSSAKTAKGKTKKLVKKSGKKGKMPAALAAYRAKKGK